MKLYQRQIDSKGGSSMAEAHAEDKQHQRIVQRIVRNILKKGCPPGKVSISGIQSPDLEMWARRKGIIFSETQKVDLLYPELYLE